jgi:hypothetical protein
MNRRGRANGCVRQWWLRAVAATLLVFGSGSFAWAQAAKPEVSATVPPAKKAATGSTVAGERSSTSASAQPAKAPPASASAGATATAAPSAGAGAAGAGAAGAGPSTASSPDAGTAAGSTPARPTPSADAATAAPAPSGSLDATTYVVRLRDLESRVDELKEQIRRSHTRLSLLSDTILSGGIGGAEADIVFRNEMSNAFRVVSVLFVLDGAVMKKEQDDTGELAAKKTIPVYNGPLTPGDHTLQVVVVFQGHGYGVFSYLRAHKYTTKHTHSFTVTEGKVARIEATAFEKGGVTTPIDQRPNVRFTEKIVGSLEAKTGSN